MKKIKIGQIGIGHNHGEAKMLAVRKFPELFEVIGYAEDDVKNGGTLILKATSTLDGTVTWKTITWDKDETLSDSDTVKDWVEPAEGYKFFTGGVVVK